MPDVLILKHEAIERKCLLVRDYLITLDNHNESMSKKQVLNLCRDLITGLLDILELIDDEQERANG
jgi:hypothetical protein